MLIHNVALAATCVCLRGPAVYNVHDKFNLRLKVITAQQVHVSVGFDLFDLKS